ncbi:MAG: tRNA lysidine(34) synthetase TilS [Gammaproteobacteria bacterium 28-57-27]|nr:MAG: tRNA lysidine(34) synthetase TilS [Gammaproteobacteria bacterium 28-57-27]
MDNWLAELLAAIPAHLRRRTLYLAFSGGLDSTVLLHGLVALQRAGKIAELRVLHVHHGLQAAADDWAESAQRLATELNVPLQVLRVEVDKQAGQGVEAAARAARYAALTETMAAGDVLLTAHHLDDQAETFMLQLMRGAGVRGLSAMPMLQLLALPKGEANGQAKNHAWHLRPLLHVSRQTLQQLAVQQGLAWVDDPSNADTRFARNLVRHAVLPRLQQHWPQATQTLARCAERMASTEGLLLDLARLDLEGLRSEETHRLCVDGLRRLSTARMHNAVRAWLLELGLPAPPAARLHELQRVLDARVDAAPQLVWPGVKLRRWRGGLYALLDVIDPTLNWPGCTWSLQHPLELPELSLRLVASYVLGSGLKPHLLQQGVYVCVRQEASLPPVASRTSLSKRLQELGVPPWLRASLPLIYCGDSLLQISDLWRSPSFCVQAHEEGVMIRVERLV